MIYLHQVVLLGNSGVGKTSILEGRDPEGIPPPATIGSSFKTYDMEKEGVCLQVWDTAGQERFRCMVRFNFPLLLLLFPFLHIGPA